MRKATTAAATPQPSVSAPRHDRAVVDEPAALRRPGRRRRSTRRGAAGRSRRRRRPRSPPPAASRSDRAAGGCCRGRDELVGERRQPQHGADADGDEQASGGRPDARRAPACGPDVRGNDTERRPCRRPSGRYGTWVWAQNDAAATSGTSGDGVAGQDRPGGEQHDDPGHEREVRVPRLGQRHQAVAGRTTAISGGDGGQAAPRRAGGRRARARADGDEVDDDRAGLERPRRRPEQAVRRGQQVEAERAGMAALVGVLADASRQPDQRGVRPTDVADPELGHRQVEHRVPRAAAQDGDGHDQRQPDERAPRRPRPHPVALDRRGQPVRAAEGRARSVAPAVSITPVTVATRNPRLHADAR